MKKIFFLLAGIFITGFVFSQQSSTNSVFTERNIEMISDCPVHQINTDSILRYKKSVSGEITKYGEVVSVDISTKSDGIWKKTKNNSYVWMCRIKAKGSSSLSVVFGKWQLPEDAKLYIYNSTQTTIDGPYIDESIENPFKTVFSTIIDGDEMVIEIETSEKSKTLIEIDRIVCGYPKEEKTVNRTQVDANCGEGKNWYATAGSVVKLRICSSLKNGYIKGTGTLLNNTNNDRKPYILTAFHILDNGSLDSLSSDHDNGLLSDEEKYLVENNSFFEFRYASSHCGSNQEKLGIKLIGCTVRAYWAESDFALLELNRTPSLESICYAGWNRGTVPSGASVCLHHPRGEVLKFAKDNDGAVLESNDTRLRAEWDIGYTEGGSSGAPLFDSNHRVIGQAEGGFAVKKITKFNCFSKSWTGGGTPSTRLKDWLAPGMSNPPETLNSLKNEINGKNIICGEDYVEYSLDWGFAHWKTNNNNVSLYSKNSSGNYFPILSLFTYPKVYAKRNGYSGSFKLNVFQNYDDSLPILSKTVWAGKPQKPSNIIGFPYNGMNFGSNSYYNFRISLPNQGASSYEWSVGGGTIVSGQGTNWITVLTGNANSGNNIYFNVDVKAVNDCGCSPIFL